MIKNKKIVVLLLLIISFSYDFSYSQSKNVKERAQVEQIVKNNDTLYYMRTPNALITGTRKPKITGNDARLGLAVYVTYGVAKDARKEFDAMNKGLELIGDDKKARKKYIKSVEESIIERYTPTLNRISMYQGRVLLKLIDRELGNTSYQAVKDLKGGFSAFFWQGVARIFGANLKTEMSQSREDQLIDFYAKLYDQGVLYQYLRDRTTALEPQKRGQNR